MGGEALTNLHLRDLLPEDLTEVLEIEQTAFSAPWSRILFMNEIFKPRSLPKVAELDGAVVGYICGNYLFEEGHILNVTVHQDFRKQGIASRLISHMLSLFEKEGCSIVLLEVRRSNAAALGAYEKAGFRQLAVRKAYYTLPVEDGVVMSLQLKS